MLALLSVPLDRLLHRAAHFETRLEARRACQSGRVSVGGRVAHGNAQVLDPTAAALSLRLDGQLLPPPPPCEYIAFHKPQGYITSMSADTSAQRRREGRSLPSVGDLLRAVRGGRSAVGISPIGRLDSEGLLLATNDGALAHALLRPGGTPRSYIAAVRARGGRGGGGGGARPHPHPHPHPHPNPNPSPSPNPNPDQVETAAAALQGRQRPSMARRFDAASKAAS